MAQEAREAALAQAQSIAGSVATSVSVCSRASSPVVALNPGMTKSLENLVNIRKTTKSSSAAKLCSISRKAVEAEQRVVGLKQAWVKTRVVERKQDAIQEAELQRQRARGLPHGQKVCAL